MKAETVQTLCVLILFATIFACAYAARLIFVNGYFWESFLPFIPFSLVVSACGYVIEHYE